jgi:hypothetical protein
MAVNGLIFDGERFRMARRAFQATCEMFAPDSPPIQRLHYIRSRLDLGDFQHFVDAINGAGPTLM